MALPERIARRIGATDGCWEWIGRRTDSGYGLLTVDGKNKRAHRLVYEALVGPIPAGLTLDHLCRNRLCVNPAHLEPVTIGVNVLRGAGCTARNAVKTECVNGHPFTEENTYHGRLDRACRRCGNDYQRRRRERLRAASA